MGIKEKRNVKLEGLYYGNTTPCHKCVTYGCRSNNIVWGRAVVGTVNQGCTPLLCRGADAESRVNSTIDLEDFILAMLLVVRGLPDGGEGCLADITRKKCSLGLTRAASASRRGRW